MDNGEPDAQDCSECDLQAEQMKAQERVHPVFHAIAEWLRKFLY